MKLILDKNFIQEVEEFPKETKRGFKYRWYLAEWEEVELYDVEANEIAPIVRFLATGKKNKVSWLLIIIGWLISLVFFIIVIYFMTSKSEPQQWFVQPQITKEVPLESTAEQPEVEIVKTETETEEWTETSWGLNLMNEVDTYKDLSNEARIEIERLNYQVDLKDIEINKLTNMVNNLQIENTELRNQVSVIDNRNAETPTDEFIYYLGDMLYKKCKKETDEKQIQNCQQIYYKFLEYGTK